MSRPGLVAAMEAEMEMEENAVEVAGLAEGPDSLESTMLETQEAGAEVEGQLEDIDTAATAVDELEGHAEIMEDSLETGGMDETAARTVELAVESLCKRLKLTRRPTMPAMEAYGDKSNRIAATKMAMEGVKEVAVKIYEAIKKAILATGQYIKEFLMKLFDGNTKVAERSKKLLEMLPKLKGAEMKEKEISAAGFAQKLQMDGSLDAGVLAKGLDLVNNLISNNEGLTKLLDDACNVDVENDEATLFDLTQGMKKVGKAEGFEEPAGIFATYRGDKLPGNMALNVRSWGKGTHLIALSGAKEMPKFRIDSFSNKDTAFKGEKVATLTTDQIEIVLKKVQTISNNITASKAEADKLMKARAGLFEILKKTGAAVSKIDTMKRTQSDDDTKAAEGAANEAGKAFLVRTLNSITAKCITSASSFSVNACKASLDYVQKSMAQYKGGPVTELKENTKANAA